MTLVLLTDPLAVVAQAQQRSGRRVLTNEDVERPAPSPPVAEAAPEQAPATESAPAAATSTQPPGGPPSELKRALELQATFKDALQVFDEKFQKETVEARKQRWETMVDCLNTLFQYNQLIINELQGSPEPAGEAAP